ncbi:hypothetical protein H9Q69_001435 [Fusarium xylarioides]|nr:hypothetical protein H9Q69_001435 [Fusarium xylarioides]
MPSNNAAWLVAAKTSPLEVKEAPLTEPSPGHILVKNSAIAINPVDIANQYVGIFIQPSQYPVILGEDVAGTVEAVGPDVTAFKPGDRVLGYATSLATKDNAHSAFQEYTVIRAECASKIPEGLSFEQAAVLPLSLATAAWSLFGDVTLAMRYPSLNPKPTGETVVIWGGSSSVGGSAVQLAKDPEEWAMVQKNVLVQCDEPLDGVADGILEDPNLCQYRPEALVCSAGQTKNCLTGPQIETVCKVFGPLYGNNGTYIYPRIPPGADQGFGFAISEQPFPYSTEWFQYVIWNDTKWDPNTIGPNDYQKASEVNPFNVETCGWSLGADHVFEYKSPQVTKDIASLLTGKKLAGAFDASGSEDGMNSASQSIVHADGLRKLICVRSTSSEVAGVEAKTILSTSIINTPVAKAVFGDYIPAALEQGKFKAVPEAEVVGKGLEAVQLGINTLAKGVSAKKIVVAL